MIFGPDLLAVDENVWGLDGFEMRECGKCTEGNRRTLEVIYNNCERWANRHVAVFALNKSFGPKESKSRNRAHMYKRNGEKCFNSRWL